MVDVKSLLTPKVIFPVVGVCVLVAVVALVTVFYVRNPTVTDSLFMSGDTTGAMGDHKTTASPMEYTGSNSSAVAFSSDRGSSSFGSHDFKPQTTHEAISLLTTLGTTTTSSVTTEPKAIEPVKHQ